VTANGNALMIWSSKQLMSSTSPICWAPTTDVPGAQSGGTADVGFGRLAAAGTAGMKTCDVANKPSWSASFFANPASSILTITAGVITPTNGVHHVTGTGLTTITVPATCTPTCWIRIIPDQAYTYDASVNIVVPAGGGNAVVNKVMDFVWDGTKWTPSY